MLPGKSIVVTADYTVLWVRVNYFTYTVSIYKIVSPLFANNKKGLVDYFTAS